jgi:hypothetical protein
MMALDKAAILQKAKPRLIEVSVPEWDGTVFLREITAGQRDQFDAWQLAQTEDTRFRDIRARLLVMSLADAEGNLLFSMGEIATVSGFPASVVNRLWESAIDLNGMRPGGEAEKN